MCVSTANGRGTVRKTPHPSCYDHDTSWAKLQTQEILGDIFLYGQNLKTRSTFDVAFLGRRSGCGHCMVICSSRPPSITRKEKSSGTTLDGKTIATETIWVVVPGSHHSDGKRRGKTREQVDKQQKCQKVHDFRLQLKDHGLIDHQNLEH